MDVWKAIRRGSWKVAMIAAKGGYEAVKYTGKQLVGRRKEIVGTSVGVIKGTCGLLYDASGNLISDEKLQAKDREVQLQAKQFVELSEQLKSKLQKNLPNKRAVLDSLFVGGATLLDYVKDKNVPEDVSRAYELAYPNIAAQRSFLEQVQSLDSDEILGFTSGIKGKLFEIEYVDYLNSGNLPEGYIAELAKSPNNPGWDIAILGEAGELKDVIQAKATDSVSYVADAISKYPSIDVVSTSEVYGQLVMQGYGENVINSGIAEDSLSARIDDAGNITDSFGDWVPPITMLALIAFSSYNEKDLSNYRKCVMFGERSMKAYLSFIAGTALTIATNTWWVGLIGSITSRLIIGRGKNKREHLHHLDALIAENKRQLFRLKTCAD